MSRYKTKKFDTKKEFEVWLKKTAKYLVHIEDRGQDFLKWWLDDRGEVLHSDMQSSVWNGKIVDLKVLKSMNIIGFKNGGALNYRAERIEKL